MAMTVQARQYLSTPLTLSQPTAGSDTLPVAYEGLPTASEALPAASVFLPTAFEAIPTQVITLYKAADPIRLMGPRELMIM